MGIISISLVIVAVAVLVVKVWYQSTMKMCRSTRRMDGKTVIVTGANTGIGKETAKDLARRGANVILACRDLLRGNDARNEIMESTGNRHVEVMKLDLGSLKSVRDFATEFLQTKDRLDVLINNAAATGLDNKISKDGIQQELQINHYGPFLLTILLIGILKKTPSSRIITVSSLAHKFGKCEMDNLNCEKSFPGGTQLYSNAKLFNVLFANELARRLEGTGVTSNSLHPGVVKTEIGRRLPKVVAVIFATAIGFLCKNASEGAQTSVHLAVSEEVEGVSGRYFVDCMDAKMSRTSQDHDIAKQLWNKSVKMVQLTKQEMEL